MIGLMTLLCQTAAAQVEERERPAEWENLVLGGRHMDRFETMPGKVVERAQWGAETVRNRLVDNGIEQDGLSFWGGNILQDKQGLYHLYVCGWPESSRKGHMFWSNSTVFHATSQNLGGPYKIQNSIGRGITPRPTSWTTGASWSTPSTATTSPTVPRDRGSSAASSSMPVGTASSRD